MSWINRDDLMKWLDAETIEMRDVGFWREMYEDYISEHVREMPEMGIRQVMQELKRYCDDRSSCTDCPFWNDPCNGNLPMALRRIAKMDEEKNNG